MALDTDTDAAIEQRQLAQVAAAFALGTVTSARVVTEGLMNRNWRIATDRGRFAVKQILDVDPATARRQHAAVTALAARELPVLAPLATADGDTVVVVDGQAYSVAPWIDGSHREGCDLPVEDVRELGRLLGRLHACLVSAMPLAPRAVAAPVPDSASVKDRIDRYATLAAGRPAGDEMDEYVIEQLAARRTLLEQVAHLRPADGVPVCPAGWCHGDFQHLNVLYRDGAVVAVLDWDRLRVRPYAAEVARSATLLFGCGDQRGLDLSRVGAFTAGYRSVMRLSDGQLVDAVHRLWWQRVCDLWQLRLRYEHNDVSCDHLFRSANALLEWWTPRLDAVAAAFTTSS